jgi:class 3 adenylate cyclase
MTTSIDEKLAVLRAQGVSAELCARLGALIREGDPVHLARLTPPRLALAWGLAEHEVLEAFLHGTRMGLFELEWCLRCPSCTGACSPAAHLETLRRQGRCDGCDLSYESSFDDVVEITWRVHPAVRDLGKLDPKSVIAAYAQPQPVTALHAAAGQSLEGVLELAPGNYHFFKADFSAAQGMRVVAAPDPSGAEIDVVVKDDGIDRGPWSRGAGHHEVRLHNQTHDAVELVVAKVTAQPWVSGARLAAHQGFRDLFGTELIKPDESFAIRHAAFVFTDLKGSTALYERIGDSRAYALVRDHFAIMVEQVREHGGAIVKTIGDAIMATFMSPGAALRFACDMLAAFDRFNATDGTRDDVVVKVGVHGGPCIAVTLNERLDYFGRTVNLAARLQGLSEGRDIVISQSLADSGEIRTLLQELTWKEQPFGAKLKGIVGSFPVVRLLPPGAS